MQIYTGNVYKSSRGREHKKITHKKKLFLFSFSLFFFLWGETTGYLVHDRGDAAVAPVHRGRQAHVHRARRRRRRQDHHHSRRKHPPWMMACLCVCVRQNSKVCLESSLVKENEKGNEMETKGYRGLMCEGHAAHMHGECLPRLQRVMFIIVSLQNHFLILAVATKHFFFVLLAHTLPFLPECAPPASPAPWLPGRCPARLMGGSCAATAKNSHNEGGKEHPPLTELLNG